MNEVLGIRLLGVEEFEVEVDWVICLFFFWHVHSVVLLVL